MKRLALRSSRRYGQLQRRSVWTCLALLAAVVPLAAQPVSPGVSLTRPAAGTANRLDVLRTDEATVVVLQSESSAAIPGGQTMVRDAVLQWEMFLLGTSLPYRVVDDRELARGVPGDTRLLILPAAEALSDAQRRQIERFVERGGGVFASGRVGFFDERGRTVGDDFFRALFGAELITALPEQASGILQALDGGHTSTLGLPMGYRLNLARQLPMAAARPTSSTSLGRPYPYTFDPSAGVADPFADVTMALYGTYGTGRVAWLRFQPQDVSREAEQQAVYQAFVLNTLAYLAGVPAAGLRAWPGGQPSATVFAARPLIGNDVDFLTGTNQVLDALESANAPATFFLTSKEAILFPDLVRRIDAQGEVALSADEDRVLKKSPAEVQAQRLETALRDLQPFVSNPIVGLAPPGNFYDVGTARAMRQAGLRYLLLPGTGESAAPRVLDWYRDADFRKTLLADADAGAPNTAAERRTAQGDRLFALPSTGRDDYTVLTLLGTAGEPTAQLAAYRDDFNRIHRAHGLYVLPFHAELQGLTAERAGVLAGLAEHARRQGSWLTTLRDVFQWWLQHEQLGVTIAELTDRTLTLDVMNASDQPVTNVAFDVLPGGVMRSVTADGGATVRLAGDGRVATVVVPSVRSGTNHITLTFERR